jgi:hypothetical protein
VVHTLQRVGGALRLVAPRTEDSSRTVPLPLPCVDALREHLAQQQMNGPTPGLTGKITDSCFPHGEVRRWSLTICVRCGT